MAKKDIVGGTTGAITASGFNGDVDGWSAEITADSVRWRTFANKWKKSKNVAYQMQGQFTGTIQFDDANSAPVPKNTGGTVKETSFEGVSLTLTAETGCTFTGTANVVGVNLQRTAVDRMTGTFRFEFDGQPTETWDESGA